MAGRKTRELMLCCLYALPNVLKYHTVY